MSSYSVDAIKRQAFEDELRNHLMIESFYGEDARDEKWCMVTEYLEDRIKEIDKQYGLEYNGQER